jgi:alkyl hydroperoxide reductase subunit F
VHSKRPELVDFLTGIAEVSDKLSFDEQDTQGLLRSPISFMLKTSGAPNGIMFSGIPSGHEFNSLILAILQSGGSELRLDEGIKTIIGGIQEELNFEVFVSLSCHNCPDIVQALNQFALINPNISNEMIDGGLFQELINERDIQGVPSVFLNGELFANGKVEITNLIEKLQSNLVTTPQVQSEVKALPLQDVVVIGGGPAAISAAIYSARKGLKVTMVAEKMGGQVKDTMGIENLISVSSTTGPKLTTDMQSHMKDYDVTLKEHLKITEIIKGDIKTLVLSSGERIETKTVIIATGARWRELGVPGEKENIGNGVAYCPHCDGPFFKDKDVSVVGGGNSGIEAALDLSGLAKSVTVLEFLPELKADKILSDKAFQKQNISIHTNVETKRIIATDGKVSSIEYKNRETGELHEEDLEGVFVQIGLIPNSQFLGDVVELSPYGEVIINENGETSEPGIFACGDVTTVPYKQIIISMGEGAKASLSASDYLMKLAPAELEQVS